MYICVIDHGLMHLPIALLGVAKGHHAISNVGTGVINHIATCYYQADGDSECRICSCCDLDNY